MFDKIKAFITTYWTPIRDVFIAVIGFFYLKSYFQKDLKAQVLTENTTATSNALDTQKAALAAGEAKLEQANNAAANAQAVADARLKNMTPEEITAYYNGQGNKQ